jgi:hypothetical protein
MSTSHTTRTAKEGKLLSLDHNQIPPSYERSFLPGDTIFFKSRDAWYRCDGDQNRKSRLMYPNTPRLRTRYWPVHQALNRCSDCLLDKIFLGILSVLALGIVLALYKAIPSKLGKAALVGMVVLPSYTIFGFSWWVGSSMSVAFHLPTGKIVVYIPLARAVIRGSADLHGELVQRPGHLRVRNLRLHQHSGNVEGF